jgi:hypothetical protein
MSGHKELTVEIISGELKCRMTPALARSLADHLIDQAARAKGKRYDSIRNTFIPLDAKQQENKES